MKILPLILAAGLLNPALTARAGESPAVRTSSGVPANARVIRNLAYVANGHERQQLDLYLPAQTNQPLPLVIWIHGGAWMGGSKEDGPAALLVARGYAVASVNYRLSQHAIFPAQIEDCKAAVRWLRAHAAEYHLDSNRFGAWGASAGGHLVAMLGVCGDAKQFEVGSHLDQSSRVQCVVDYFGPAEMLTMGKQSGPNSQLDHDTPNSPESRLLGGPVQEKRELATIASPMHYATKDDAPMLIVHGDQDPVVPFAQSETFHAALKQAGVDATLRVVKGAGHGTGFGADERQAVEMFFQKHLQPASRR